MTRLEKVSDDSDSSLTRRARNSDLTKMTWRKEKKCNGVEAI